jgi:hypothetical protein
MIFWRYVPLSFLFGLLLFKVGVSQENEPNPCMDSLYLALKQVPLDSMSNRQYEYFMQKDKLCLENLKSGLAPDTPKAKLVVSFGQKREYKLSGFTIDKSVYVNNVFYGTGPRTIEVSPGEHTVSMFSEQAISSARGDDKLRMSTGRVTVNCPAGKTGILQFIFICEEYFCDGNEWRISPTYFVK